MTNNRIRFEIRRKNKTPNSIRIVFSLLKIKKVNTQGERERRLRMPTISTTAMNYSPSP